MAKYIGIDKERYDAGNKFLSQDKYLANYNPRDAITFNETPIINQGIVGKYPYPIIPMYGDSDGGGGPIGPKGNSKFDYETEAYGLKNLSPEQKGLTQEEQDIINAQRNKDRLKQAAQLGLFALNPAGYIMSKGIKAGYDKIFGGGNEGGGDGGSNKVTTTDYYSPGGGYEGSDEQDRDNEAAADTAATAGDAPGYSGPTTFEYGGRVGFGNGGLSTYEIFKLGELGFDTKGGTVTAPFGGIKVLRDILRVNQYAYGGRAGFARGGRTDAESQYGADSYGSYSYDDDNNRGDDNNNPPSNDVQTSNLNFNLVRDIDPSFNYASRFGTLGGVLNTTRTIEEEEPVGTVGYYSPTGNFGIGYDTDKGPIGTANLGNLNLGYTGTGGPTLNYSGAFGNDAGRFGVNYNRDSGLNLGVSYNRTFNNGGIVGLYR